MSKSQSGVVDLVNEGPISVQQVYQLQIMSCEKERGEKQNRKNALLSLQQFRIIHDIWSVKVDKSLIIKEKKKIPMNLTYYNLKRLAYGYQLNDQIINSYLFLLSQQNSTQQAPFKILDSLLTISILGFRKPFQVIKKSLLKKNITSNNFLILTINYQKHWFFIVLTNKKLCVYDSLMKESSYYNSIGLLTVLKEVADRFYDNQYDIQICQSFPQQSNTSECGVMMLLGIKDIMRMSNTWTFDQKRARSLRPLIAYELLTEKMKDVQ